MTLIIAVLITYRLTLLVTQESAPFEALSRFRDWIGVHYDEFSRCTGRNEIAKALCCFWCTSVWIGLLTALIMGAPVWYALAYSGGAVFLYEVTKHAG